MNCPLSCSGGWKPPSLSSCLSSSFVNCFWGDFSQRCWILSSFSPYALPGLAVLQTNVLPLQLTSCTCLTYLNIWKRPPQAGRWPSVPWEFPKCDIEILELSCLNGWVLWRTSESQDLCKPHVWEESWGARGAGGATEWLKWLHSSCPPVKIQQV